MPPLRGAVGACYIGQIVSLPATILLFTVAFLMMTGQPIAGDIDS